jgi:hypothetical protein
VLGARPAVVDALSLWPVHRGVLRTIVSGKPLPACPIFTASPIDSDSKVRSTVLARLHDDLIKA